MISLQHGTKDVNAISGPEGTPNSSNSEGKTSVAIQIFPHKNYIILYLILRHKFHLCL